MFELLDLKQSGNHLELSILLDTSKASDPSYSLVLKVPAPGKGVTLDSYLTNLLPTLTPQLNARLTLLNTPPYDPFSKWRGHQFS